MQIGGKAVTVNKNLDFNRLLKMCSTFLFYKIELIVPAPFTSQCFFKHIFLRMRADIVPKNTFQIVYYYTLQRTILKFIVLDLGSEQAADLILMRERG